MTDKEIMYHRFQKNHLKKHTGLLAEMLGMSRKDYEDAVRRGMKQEADEFRKDDNDDISSILEEMEFDETHPDMDDVLDYLEKSYTGAKATEDYESMLRISRAIRAYKLDIYKDCIIQGVSHENNC